MSYFTSNKQGGSRGCWGGDVIGHEGLRDVAGFPVVTVWFLDEHNVYFVVNREWRVAYA